MPALVLPSLHNFSIDTIVQTPTTPTRTAFVFGWDNFVCPSTWLQQTMAIHPNQLQHPLLLQQLALLDHCIVNVLRQAHDIGPVFVMCESISTTLQMCQAFFPSCYHLFSTSQVPLVASPSVSNTLDEICANHLNIAMSLFAPQSTLVILGLSSLRLSTTQMQYHSWIVTKLVSSVRVQPSVLDVMNQLQTLSNGLLSVVVQHTSSLNMTL
ncbi:hypothetical protein THRCLA_10841 [Thraustotheca clavata]|uniref:Uncharacterized protein n=1 Tax=Thraustotheca clavata TaxID=74557 RepID=A0A1V9YF42_9STRA|nr:hypothetical protein THRCLA_10841 [Thraustotheca clavata]